ncbi:hypothetical protein GN956_G12833 [Arapaima gigas]
MRSKVAVTSSAAQVLSGGTERRPLVAPRFGTARITAQTSVLFVIFASSTEPCGGIEPRLSFWPLDRMSSGRWIRKQTPQR